MLWPLIGKLVELDGHPATSSKVGCPIVFCWRLRYPNKHWHYAPYPRPSSNPSVSGFVGDTCWEKALSLLPPFPSQSVCLEVYTLARNPSYPMTKSTPRNSHGNRWFNLLLVGISWDISEASHWISPWISTLTRRWFQVSCIFGICTPPNLGKLDVQFTNMICFLIWVAWVPITYSSVYFCWKNAQHICVQILTNKICVAVTTTTATTTTTTLSCFFRTENWYFLVMELVGGGELFDVIVRNKSLTEMEASHLVVVKNLGYTMVHPRNLT